MKLDLSWSRLGKLTVKAIGIACGLLTVVLLFVVSWGGSYPSYDPNPPVLIPRQGDVWHVGELHTVEWSVDGIRTTNSSGKPVLALLILAYWTQTTEPALLRHEPLTDWIPLTDQMANVIVPSVPTRSDYAIFLSAHDDRSSSSGTITIFNPDDPTGAGDPPRTLTVTTAPPISVTVSLPPPSALSESVTSNSTEISTTATPTTAISSASLTSGAPTSTPSSSESTVSDVPTPTPTPALSPREARPLVVSSAGELRGELLGGFIATLLLILVNIS